MRTVNVEVIRDDDIPREGKTVAVRGLNGEIFRVRRTKSGACFEVWHALAWEQPLTQTQWRPCINLGVLRSIIVEHSTDS